MSEPDKKRRLPLLSNGPSGASPGHDPDKEEERPPWHWAAIGAVTTFLVWLPLAAIAAKVGARIASHAELGVAVTEGTQTVPVFEQLAVIGLQLAGFVIATLAGGFLVGRFGGKAGPKEAAAGAFFAAALAWALAASAPGPGPGLKTWATLLLLLGGLGASLGYWGGRLGLKKRPPSERP